MTQVEVEGEAMQSCAAVRIRCWGAQGVRGRAAAGQHGWELRICPEPSDPEEPRGVSEVHVDRLLTPAASYLNQNPH